MALSNSTQNDSSLQPAACVGYAGLSTTLDGIDDAPVLDRLQAYRHTGRPGHPLKALWRSYVASFLLNLPHTNALIRRLQDESDLRSLCGFTSDALPSRRTFNRFIRRLSNHADLVEVVLTGLTNRLKEFLPDLGESVALDSSTVRTHSNPNRKRISDPDASWTAKNSARAKSKDGKEWHFGYKSHAVADAQYGLPLGQIITTASRSDSPELPRLIERAKGLLPWFKPKVIIADRGYDALSNHEYAVKHEALPIIHIRKQVKGSIYTTKGTPTCLGRVPMTYVRSDPELGRLYQCRPDGCHLKDSFKGGTRHCMDWVWEDPTKDLRLFGIIRRDGPEWKAHYVKRQAIERVFKSLKESRRLERHCVRGLRQITLHVLMSTLAFQATALVWILAGEAEWMRWMVRKVA